MKLYIVTVSEKGAPELQASIPAVSPGSAKRQAVTRALIMGYRHPRVVSCREAPSITPAMKAGMELGLVP